MRWGPYKLKDRLYAEYLTVSDGGYAVMRCVVEGIPTDRYLAFRGLSGSPGFQVLGGYGSEEDAKAACEANKAQSCEIA